MATKSAAGSIESVKKTPVVSPSRFAHVVFRTSRFEEMINWYKVVLKCETAYENDFVAFLTYDEEHHRVALVKIPELDEQPDGICGMHHVAFTYNDLHELLGNFVRLKEKGIEPVWCVNHGPTTSLYYADPDKNQLEFQVDNYETVEKAGEFFLTEEFAANPIGVNFDPDELYGRLLAGEDESKLKIRPPSGPVGTEGIGIR